MKIEIADYCIRCTMADRVRQASDDCAVAAIRIKK